MNKNRTAPRATPDAQYVCVWAALVLLTGLTVLAAQINMGTFNVLVALVIASIKGSLVLYFFMHLGHEGRALKLMLLLTIMTLGIIIFMTFADIGFRYYNG